MAQDIDQTLAELIAPLTPEEFFLEYWGKRILVVKGAHARFRAIFSEATWRTTLLRETMMVAEGVDGANRQRSVRIQPSELHDLYDAGYATVGRVDHVPSVSALMDGLRASIQHPSGETSFVDGVLCFASKDGKGFNLHWDIPHNFILQISGKKRWHHGRVPAVEAPWHGAASVAAGELALAYGDELVMMPALEELEETMLEPGDFLYLPPGLWHMPRAVGHSIHLSVVMFHRPVLKLILDVLREELSTLPAWRRGFPLPVGAQRGSGAVPDGVSAAIDEGLAILRERLAHIDPRVFHREWSAHTAQHHGSVPAFRPAQVQRTDRLRRATAVPIRYCIAPSERCAGEDDVFVFAGDLSHLALPQVAHDFIARLCATPSFVAESALSWDTRFDWSEVQDVLDQFLARGLLVREES